MGDEQILQEFLQRMVSAGLISLQTPFTEDQLTTILSYLKSGDEGSALAYVQSRGQSVDWAAEDAATISGAKGGGTQPNTPSLVNTWQDPNTGQWFYMVPQVNKDGELINYLPTPFTPPKADNPADLFVGFDYEMTPGWMTPVFKKPDGSQYAKQPTQKAIVPDTGEPSPFEREQFEYGKSQDAASAALAREKWEADQRQIESQRQSDIWVDKEAAIQAYERRLANEEQTIRGNKGLAPWPTNTPTNWIDYWKRAATPQPTSRISRAEFLKSNMPASEWQGLWQRTGVDTQKQQVWDPLIGRMREENQEEFDQRVFRVPLQKLAEGEGTISSGSQTNIGSPDYIPTNEDEAYAFRQIQLAEGEKPRLWQNLTPEEQAGRQETLNNTRMELMPSRTGPELPQWASGLGVPTKTFGGQPRVDVRRLSRWDATPVSAQTWQNWRPSEREGYVGLVGASKSKQSLESGDYMDNLGKMWSSSRRGQLAVRR